MCKTPWNATSIRSKESECQKIVIIDNHISNKFREKDSFPFKPSM